MMRIIVTSLALATGATVMTSGHQVSNTTDTSSSSSSEYFVTNSHLHHEERAFPLHRHGHNRGSAKVCGAECNVADINSRMSKVMEMKIKHHNECAMASACPINRPGIYGDVDAGKCKDGKVHGYDCSNVDILSFVPICEMGSVLDASDIWGWTDPETGTEVAIIGMMDGTAFVDVTDAVNPDVLGFLPQTGTNNVIWSDMKVFANHAFIVRESRRHGMQVYDMTKLREFYNKPTSHVRQLTMDAHYTADGKLGSSHNIIINTETGFAYVVGATICRGGLHVVDISKPQEPRFAGCFDSDGYTHDAQCVIYDGPDARFVGREICFNYNEDSLTLVDVSDKDNMTMLSRVGYKGSAYTHQGWLSEDSSMLLLNDELDEVQLTTPDHTPNTRTMMWDVNDLTNPFLTGSFIANDKAVDHNLYIRGSKAYLSNYCAGLRVLDVTNIAESDISEVAYLDIADYCDTAEFQGTWSNYPYFASGNVIVSSIELGLFTLKVNV